MEDAFHDLLWLIWKANNALNYTPPCMVTARAYLKMAEAATFGLLALTNNPDEYKRLQRVCGYSERFCFRQTNWTAVAHFMSRFWEGVYHGFFDHTQNRDGKYYENGYKMVRYGS